MRKFILSATVGVLALSTSTAYAADFVLDVSPQTTQSSRFDDGREVVDDVGQASSVRIFEPKQQTPQQSGFRVLVANTGSKPLNFGPESITIRLADGTAVAMLTYQDLLKQQQRREMWQGIAAGLAAAGRNMSASDAGTSYGTVSGSTNTFGNFGSTPFSARTSTFGTFTTYNPAAAAAAQATADAQNQRQLEQLRMNQAAAREDLNQVMKMTTVDPGQVFGGIVLYMVPKAVQSSKTPVPITIEVKTGDEVHTFKATLGKYRR